MEMRKNRQSAIRTIIEKDEEQSEELANILIDKMKIGKILTRQAMAWCSYWLQIFPLKMTLNNIGLLTVLLAIVLPRYFIYQLVYPIFRLVFGTLYPAYASYKAVRTKNVKEYVKWMMYWIVFALFTCAETFTDVFFSFWFPFYYEIKIILVLWLLSPATKGSSILYRRFVHPALIRREAEIDEALARATEQGYTAVLHLGTKGVNYATTVLMQTAIKGGGGLVQQLRKSYSLSDLTGEKEDENRNTTDAHDGTGMEVQPRRREHAGRRNYSPRRTQSSSNRVEMYFAEVDVDVRQPKPREPIASLTNIKSSEDISSGYSSGEALQSHRTNPQGDSLVRTSSVGTRTRMKPRSTTRKTPEDRDEDLNYIDHPSPLNISLPSSLNILTPEQAVELILLLSQYTQTKDCSTLESDMTRIVDDNYEDADRFIIKESESSSIESDIGCVDVKSTEMQSNIQTIQTIEIKNISAENLSIPALAKNVDEVNSDLSVMEHDQNKTNMQIGYTDDEIKDNQKQFCELDICPDSEGLTDEICHRKLDELKQLLNDTHKTATNIVSTQKKLNALDKDKKYDKDTTEVKFTTDNSSSTLNTDDVIVQSLVVADLSNCNSDNDNRAGKYNKKPAPKAPITSNEDDSNEIEPQNALKATLVIKTGTLKTFSNVDATKDVFLAHASGSTKRKKKSNKSRAKESFSKLLTIPKNMFHNAFHKEQNESSKEEDSSSTISETSRSASRSGSTESQIFLDASSKLSNSKQKIDVEEIPLRPERDNNSQISDKEIHLASVKLNTQTVTLDEVKTNIAENNKSNIEHKSKSEMCDASQSAYSGREIITDIM